MLTTMFDCGSRRLVTRLAVAVLALWFWPVHTAAQQVTRPRSVLMLFGNRGTAPAVGSIETAFRRAVEEGLGSPVDVHAEYLDLSPASSPSYARRLTDLLADKYAGLPIEVVVVHRSETLEYLLQNRERLFPGVPVVFTDVSHGELERLHPPPDVTGTVHDTEGQRTIQVAVDLQPGAERLVVVAGASTFDRGTVAFAHRLAEARYPKLEVLSLAGLALDEQLQRVAALPDHSVVVFTSYRVDTLGRSMVARDVLRLFTKASRAPVFGAVDSWLGLGIVGGDLIRYDILGERAAALAVRLLKGEPIAALTPKAEPASALMFDARELRRWHIDEARLPAGSTVLFREPTLWSQYKTQVLWAAALLVGQGLLIGALLVERRSRRRAQAGLAEAEQRYRTVADFTADWEYWVRPDGSFVYNSPSCVEITGHQAAAFEARPALLSEIVAVDDREKWDAHVREAPTRAAQTRLEFRIQTVTGEIRWIDHVCTRVVGADGRDLGTRGSNRDITGRKQSENDLRGALEEIRQLRDRLEVDNTYLREQLQPTPDIGGMVWTSDIMRYVLSKAQQVAPTSSTVLLLGETGVGKSLIAQTLHDLSPRRARPLVTLNCAALPATLIESELFGHEKGAFTGAHAQRRGRFEIADASTLFLDEIGELPLDLQSKLLRAIQDGEFERVGGNVTLKTDVRLIAATNRKLDEEVRAGRFRQDLWYRLHVFPITVPPLRQRPEDIPLLVTSFIEKHCRKQGKPVLQVSKAAMKALQGREWAGNVRELENVVERAVISTRGPMFEIGNDPVMTVSLSPTGIGGPDDRRTLAQAERDHITATLARLHWRIEGDEGAADALGINASTLRSRMRKLGIQRPGPATS
jgi:PAS domain S-box-containing protein